MVSAYTVLLSLPLVSVLRCFPTCLHTKKSFFAYIASEATDEDTANLSAALRNYRINYDNAFAYIRTFRVLTDYEHKTVVQKRSAALGLKSDLYNRYTDLKKFVNLFPTSIGPFGILPLLLSPFSSS